MFDRFTRDAQRAVVLAQDEARALRHNHVGTEHVLLGVLGVPDCGAAVCLGQAGVTLDQARSRVTAVMGAASGVSSGQLPFTPRARVAFERAVRDADDRGVGAVDTEHLLLGILRDADGIATRVVVELGADRERLAVALQHGAAASGRVPAGLPPDDRVRVGEPVAGLLGVAFERAHEQGRRELIHADLLVAFARDRGGAELLRQLGVSEDAITRLVSQSPPPAQNSSGSAAGS